MGLEDKLSELKARVTELSTLGEVMALLNWDQACYMPPGASEDRARQMAALGALIHDKATAPEMGQLVEDLAAELGDLNADTLEAREVYLAKERFEKTAKVPRELALEIIAAEARGHDTWVKAKRENDFAVFAPDLKRIFDLAKARAEYFKPYDHVYDVLLDDYERGMKTAEVQAVFNWLKPRQTELVRRILQAPQPDDSFLERDYDLEGQRKVGEYAVRKMGYDLNEGRIDRSDHPFTTSIGRGDVRFTMRYLPSVRSSLMAHMHEGGHALHSQGLNPEWRGMYLRRGPSSGIAESQSRLWENLVGRSREFWAFFMPVMQATFPEHLASVSAEQMYRGLNRVENSLIRIEADEATYNLHVMLRMELEIALLEGNLETRDLPEAWNEKMRANLGLTPPTDSLGVLQDMHWSSGLIGYFPTYSLGNLYASQFWNQLLKEQPGIPDQVARGEFGNILEWMREKVHRVGTRYDPQVILERATGERLNPKYYMDYLTEKYTEIYGL